MFSIVFKQLDMFLPALDKANKELEARLLLEGEASVRVDGDFTLEGGSGDEEGAEGGADRDGEGGGEQKPYVQLVSYHLYCKLVVCSFF
jgi:hypothetical protein